MKKTELTESQALRLGLTLPYAYITRLSEVTVGRTPDICTTEGLEVRLMNEIRTGHVMLMTRETWEKIK